MEAFLGCLLDSLSDCRKDCYALIRRMALKAEATDRIPQLRHMHFHRRGSRSEVLRTAAVEVASVVFHQAGDLVDVVPSKAEAVAVDSEVQKVDKHPAAVGEVEMPSQGWENDTDQAAHDIDIGGSSSPQKVK